MTEAERNPLKAQLEYYENLKAETERLQQQLKEKETEMEVLKKGILKGNEFYCNLKFDDEPFTPYQIALQQLKSAQELNRELVEGLKLMSFPPGSYEADLIESLINKAQ